jgi:hypothetical protein
MEKWKMSTITQYYPNDGTYFAPESSIYAEIISSCPNPCRKYHISSDIDSALRVAAAVLPLLVERRVHHKIVKNEHLLRRQMAGSQAGKFITLYMSANLEQRNRIIEEIARRLDFVKTQFGINPSPIVPKSRTYNHIFMEQPLDENMFIYGGFITDPTV